MIRSIKLIRERIGENSWVIQNRLKERKADARGNRLLYKKSLIKEREWYNNRKRKLNNYYIMIMTWLEFKYQ